MTLHPQCHEVLRRVANWPKLAELTPADARALEGRRKLELGGPGADVHDIRPHSIPVAGGASIPALLYRPSSAIAPGLLVWLHGGGWVVGSPEHSDDQARVLANASGCAVLSVGYRLAPEHQFPQPAEDAFAAIAWASANADALGAAPRHLAVGGDSAGGNLAAAATQMARDRGGPKIDLQALVYPVTCRDLVAASRERYADGYWLTNEAMSWFWDHYLKRPEEATNPYASPLLAETLASLPPALVLLAECDLLYDEGFRYAERLRAHGVPVDCRTYAGMLHGFLSCAGVIDAASQALRELAEAVRAGLMARATPARASSVGVAPS